jgi:hypothetical protein
MVDNLILIHENLRSLHPGVVKCWYDANPSRRHQNDVSDRHTILKRIGTSCVLGTYDSCLTTFVHGFIWILKLGNS